MDQVWRNILLSQRNLCSALLAWRPKDRLEVAAPQLVMSSLQDWKAPSLVQTILDYGWVGGRVVQMRCWPLHSIAEAPRRIPLGAPLDQQVLRVSAVAQPHSGGITSSLNSPREDAYYAKPQHLAFQVCGFFATAFAFSTLTCLALRTEIATS